MSSWRHKRDVTRVPDLRVQHKLMGSSDKATIVVSEVKRDTLHILC